MYRTVAKLLVLIGLASCGATGPEFTASTMPEIESEEVLLILYRPQTFVGIANFDVPFVHLDDRLLTRIRIGGHVIVRTTTGRHTLRTTESFMGQDTDKTRGTTEFEARGGSTVYFRYTESLASVAAIPIGDVMYVQTTGYYLFEPVSENFALKELAETSRMQLED